MLCALKIIKGNQGDGSFALINNCLSEFEALDNEEGTLALTLFRSVRNMICTEARMYAVLPHEKGGQSLGTQEYSYSLYPHKGYWDEGGVYDEAERFNVPVRLVQTSKHKGTLPLEQSFFSIKPVNLIMSAFKKAEERESFIMRLFNPTDSTIEGEIYSYPVIEKAYLTDLNEERMGNLIIRQQHSVGIEVQSNKIVTVELVL